MTEFQTRAFASYAGPLLDPDERVLDITTVHPSYGPRHPYRRSDIFRILLPGIVRGSATLRAIMFGHDFCWDEQSQAGRFLALLEGGASPQTYLVLTQRRLVCCEVALSPKRMTARGAAPRAVIAHARMAGRFPFLPHRFHLEFADGSWLRALTLRRRASKRLVRLLNTPPP